MGEYAGLGLFFALGGGLAALALTLTWWIGPRMRFAEKQEPFECGERPLGSPRQRVDLKFYLVAVSFIVFDVEVVLLYPWAIVFRDLGWYGLFAATPLLAVIAVGLAYEWLKGGLEWE